MSPSPRAYPYDVTWRIGRRDLVRRVYAYNASDAAMQASVQLQHELGDESQDAKLTSISPPVEVCATELIDSLRTRLKVARAKGPADASAKSGGEGT